MALPHEIEIIRVYDAPLADVWAAWTDVEQVAKWWGPRGFTLTTHSKDLKPGGHWDYTMHGPDGTDYANVTKYFEVEPLRKLVYDHGGSHDRPPLFRVTVLFSEENGKTRMVMTSACESAEKAAEMRKFIKQASGESTWDRLAEYLEKESSGKETFVINRTFAAPIDVVYEMWSNPEHLVQWTGPTGSGMRFLNVDIRPGGESRYVMTMGTLTMYGRTQYHALEKPNRIVYSQQFCDQAGKISRHPLAPTWPETMLTVVDFTAESPDRTRVTLTWEPTGTVTAEELETFVKGRAGMTQGWTGSLDKLEEYLAK